MAAPQRLASGLPTRRAVTRQVSRRTASALTEKANQPAPSVKTPTANTPSVPRPPSDQIPSNRKPDRVYECEVSADTSIHVVVRCRGRSEYEIKENSGVAVATEGVKGKTVELSMGPNAVSNKTYTFDKVFSPAASQEILYEDVVLPILNEMLAGFNCTIFAYGQTGTGKTYTMSGDMTDTLGILSDNAGIIPRALYSLFHRLEDTDSAVKCSFIELYNEELRDLLSSDDKAKLKIFDSEPKKGQSGSTLVQGIEETYIHSASAGIKLLQLGSHRRQVAATKCNDLSSRSHTVFTVSVCTTRTTESGEEYVSSGKLNLVDLAGSENIQRSGAENKRAVEAGLINKSLLTLGRVINALVDKSPHIPYRESKLTRLLQDSLGGRTKTCIIATITNSRSNLEETMSTLDYAFRAKNIRNIPQINLNMLKGTLLKQYTIEIQKLKSELIATRHRNGVYMPADAHEEMTMEIESRRIVNEEQRAKIESMESSLRHKVQELLSLTSSLNSTKRDHEETKAALSNANDVLRKTDMTLRQTAADLEVEAMLRQSHQATEGELRGIGTKLLSSLSQAVSDVDSLHAKLERKAALDSLNQEVWQTSIAEVADVSKLVHSRIEGFQLQYSILAQGMLDRINKCVGAELAKVQSGVIQLDNFAVSSENMESDAKHLSSTASNKMTEALEEIKVLGESIKMNVSESLDGLSAAAARISKGVIAELSELHNHIYGSYCALSGDLKSVFQQVLSRLGEQNHEIKELRAQVQAANRSAVEASRRVSSSMNQFIEEESARIDEERNQLLTQVKELVESTQHKQLVRLDSKLSTLRSDVSASGDSLEKATTRYDKQMDELVFKAEQFTKEAVSTEDDIMTKMRKGWETFDEQNTSIKKTTELVYDETVRVVDAQMKSMGSQIETLDNFVAKARLRNESNQGDQLKIMDNVASDMREAYATIREQLQKLGEDASRLQQDMTEQNHALHEFMSPLFQEIRQPLSELCINVLNRPLKEYTATGVTPKKRLFEYPSFLPQTEERESLVSRLRNSKELTVLPFNGENGLSSNDMSPIASPSKQFIYNDTGDEAEAGVHAATAQVSDAKLREVDANISARLHALDTDVSDQLSSKKATSTTDTEYEDQPPPKRHCSTPAVTERILPKIAKKKAIGKSESRESVLPSAIGSGRRPRGRPFS